MILKLVNRFSMCTAAVGDTGRERLTIFIDIILVKIILGHF